MKTLNEVYSSLSTRRRYEVWFLRLGLADGSGAWWFRYLLMNPGRGGCPADPRGMPVQVWATWFPAGGKPQGFIQGFSLEGLELSGRGQNPFHLKVGSNEIGQDSCRGSLQVEGHSISWNLEYRSTFRVTLSNKGWIGFSRTPHSDASFSGKITLDGRSFEGSPLGFGLQGHNCGFRHRNFWTWTHACFPQPDGSISTFEALVYEMPLGLRFRKAVLWREGRSHIFCKLRDVVRDRESLRWHFQAWSAAGLIAVEIDGGGPSHHRLPYSKTDCSGTFEVSNNSFARARMRVQLPNCREDFATEDGAVVEMTGEY